MAAAPQSLQLAQADMTKRQYPEETDVYWQVGFPCCKTPADAGYENLGIFVPGNYMTGTDNDDSTYTCFETVWGQDHVEAGRTGDSTENFIKWVVTCCQ